MSDIERAVDGVKENRAMAETEQHYASAHQQVQELDVKDAQARVRIATHQEAIRSERESIKLRAEDRAKLKRKRRVFANAKHQLQMINEGL